ncbi:MAG: Selenophosphate-dependent tRNA 2-selenouridine synthase [Candidatus Rifleibacterium amylolyticum]|nr:MAG: Selenophosphate-dependent tRNA 2-selenouridine synthase [Candidatus Rifleibacterium amylolyticum]
MQAAIDIKKALELQRRGALMVDVRSPAEYVETTIPGAINVPIFDNAERAEIGTIYSKIGQREARRRAIELVSPKIPQILKEIDDARDPGSPPAIIFCWRGGARSLAITSFLDLAGIPALQLSGGHKAFRRHINKFFAETDFARMLIVRGPTGVGKTQLLRRLIDEKFPVVDLEGLANHRGSAFGALGLGNQPSQKMFEAALWQRLGQLHSNEYLLTEGESKHIGRLVIPERLHQAMLAGISIWVDAPLEYRIQVILQDYPARDSMAEAFKPAISSLKERLGKQVVAELLSLLGQRDWPELIRRLLVDYYDPLYLHTRPDHPVCVSITSLEDGVKKLKQAVSQLLPENLKPAAAGQI